MNAIKELLSTLQDAWRAADLAGHLRAWWWTVTHPDELNTSIQIVWIVGINE